MEENIKLVLKKILKFMKKLFNRFEFERFRTLLKQSVLDLDPEAQKEYSFAGFYFEKVCQLTQISIEAFFQPSLHRHYPTLRDRKIPKYCTKIYISLLNLSTLFTSHTRHYLEHYFLNISLNYSLRKIDNLVKKWEGKMVDDGEEALLEYVEKSLLNVKKPKLPWTLGELKFARKQFLECLNK